MINRSDFSKKLQGLKADMIGRATRIVLTVTDVEEVEIPDGRTGEAGRKALAIKSAEFPDTPYWPNGTSINILCDVLGENEEKWIGKKIPLEKVRANNPQTGREQDSLWVAKQENWGDFPGITAKAPARSSPKIVAKKNGSKKK